MGSICATARRASKIAASKQKGMWMGGVPPLGYRAQVPAAYAELLRSSRPFFLTVPRGPFCGSQSTLARTEGAGDEGDHQPDLPLARR
jgi:hypothetical protein